MEPDIRTAIIFLWGTCQDSRVKGTINNDVERLFTICTIFNITLTYSYNIMEQLFIGKTFDHFDDFVKVSNEYSIHYYPFILFVLK
ncbi:hypothetical protein BpHYR1_028608 [Brachionus plicatilis]|uniref:Uncharacterized protein n=1 Tax=Brachionus plicatilis TaxID=10195 RepID=A0A3M7Q9X3_BRAPC|nr:hypothetical protein BpHYR1_028608 [Brachionus plicatilis]